MSRSQPPPWAELESLCRRDPTQRGVASYAPNGKPLCEGHLAAAAKDLAETATRVGIVTGFCIVDAEPPAAETDGPPGALFLARALRTLDIEVLLISDRYGIPLLEAGSDLWDLPRTAIVEMPLKANSTRSPQGADSKSARGWTADFLEKGAGATLSHLVAIERVGPSHTLESLGAQHRQGAAPVDEFERAVPLEHRDVCHNMRGMPIDDVTAPLHRLFEAARLRPHPIRTIGIGDGGNEIGMGAIPWEILQSAIAWGPAAHVACRVATDHTLLAGVSDWAAYALALGTCLLRGVSEPLAHWGTGSQRALIETLVAKAGAVDGVTRRRDATVDGLPLESYLQVLTQMQEICLKSAT